MPFTTIRECRLWLEHEDFKNGRGLCIQKLSAASTLFLEITAQNTETFNWQPSDSVKRGLVGFTWFWNAARRPVTGPVLKGLSQELHGIVVALFTIPAATYIGNPIQSQ